MQLRHVAQRVLDDGCTGDEVRAAQADLTARGETEEFGRWLFHEVFALYPQLAREWHQPVPGRRVLRVIRNFDLLHVAVRVVVDYELDRVEDGEAARRGAVQNVAHGVLELADFYDAVRFGDPDGLDEVTDAGGRKAAPPQTGDGRHTRVVPALDVAVGNEAQQEALGQDGVGQIEPRELDLAGLRGHRQVLDEPVVERAVDLELERAQRVRDALNRIGLAVGEVVRRIDAPRITRSRMSGVDDAVEDGVAHVDVRRRHIDLGA